MELINRTALPAVLIRTVIDDSRMAAALVARVSYTFGARGELMRSEEQPWIVSRAPWEGPAGPMPSDEVFHRGGVDLFVFGSAWTPRARRATLVLFRVTIGDRFDYQMAVVGDRAWSGRGGSLDASDPEPFVSMPLTLARAYGGKARWDGLDIPFPDNPEGKGFCLDAADAAGKALPNLEDPQRLIRSWRDTPDPVGVGICPPAFGPRLRKSVHFSDGGFLDEIKPRFFNHAFPGMVAPAVASGDLVTIEGGAAEGPIRFTLPPPQLLMHLEVGATRMSRPLAIDQIGMELEKRRIFITYRYPFRYTIVSRQPRSCVLDVVEGGT